MKFTVLGADGYIGSALVRHLQARGNDARAVGRAEGLPTDATAHGHVIDAIGVTSDFRTRPADTVEAHVSVVNEFLSTASFDSFLYLSSTRVYLDGDSGAEASRITIDVNDPDQLYNATKIAGEARCLAVAEPAVRVARLSQIVGPDLDEVPLVGHLARQAVRGHLRVPESLDTRRDYVALDDTLDALVAIATSGAHRLYNVASGTKRSTGEVVDVLVAETGCSVEVREQGTLDRYPDIDVSRVTETLGRRPSDGIYRLPALIRSVRDAR